MNKVALVGRITKDIELHRTTNDTPVCSFTLAINRRKKDSGADFPRCKAWGRSAEVLASYVGKGDQLAVVGHIETGSYEKDGATVYTTEVVVDEFDFISSRSRSDDKDTSYTREPSQELPYYDGDPFDLPF